MQASGIIGATQFSEWEGAMADTLRVAAVQMHSTDIKADNIAGKR